MKILVFSDSHNTIAPMEAAVQETDPDLILHLGDYAMDANVLAESFPHIPLRMVRGNCDMGKGAPTQEHVTVAGRRIVMTHGHRYDVKHDYTTLYLMGQEAEADILLFGHTHIPHYEQIGNMHVLNPGSAGNRSAALIEIADGEIRCTHLSL